MTGWKTATGAVAVLVDWLRSQSDKSASDREHQLVSAKALGSHWASTTTLTDEELERDLVGQYGGDPELLEAAQLGARQWRVRWSQAAPTDSVPDAPVPIGAFLPSARQALKAPTKVAVG